MDVVVVVDVGRPRNAPAAGVHGLLGHDGVPPGALLERGRAEVEGYGGQVIDDEAGSTLAAASTVEKDIAAQIGEMDKKGASKLVGKTVAERALAKGIKEVVFDRGGYIYTGRVAKLAEGAREGGLDF